MASSKWRTPASRISHLKHEEKFYEGCPALCRWSARIPSGQRTETATNVGSGHPQWLFSYSGLMLGRIASLGCGVKARLSANALARIAVLSAMCKASVHNCSNCATKMLRLLPISIRSVSAESLKPTNLLALSRLTLADSSTSFLC